MEADRMTEKVWRACILYDLKKPEKWIEYQADTLETLLREVKNCTCAVRIIIYRRLK
jgi:hypothetical protein